MTEPNKHEGPFDLEASRLVAQAKAIAGFDLGRDARRASAENASGVRAGSMSFMVRHDSRTIVAVDAEYGNTRKAGTWTGDDKAVIDACRAALKESGVPKEEIADVRVLSEFGQIAERVSAEKFRLEEPQLLRKVARARRAMQEIPVWSSYAIAGLTRAGRVGHLEVHWPHISPSVLEEALLLTRVVESGFNPPAQAGARVERVEAGIIHSPAIGFFLDAVAAIRVVYRANTPTVGRKPTLYLDRHGKPVVSPRHIDLARPPAERRGAAALPSIEA
jgi:hypothetical protein